MGLNIGADRVCDRCRKRAEGCLNLLLGRDRQLFRIIEQDIHRDPKIISQAFSNFRAWAIILQPATDSAHADGERGCDVANCKASLPAQLSKLGWEVGQNRTKPLTCSSLSGFVRFMASVTSPRAQAPKPAPLDSRRIRSKLILKGYSLRSWAKVQGVSAPTVSQLISGAKAGRSGRSALARAKLEELSR